MQDPSSTSSSATLIGHLTEVHGDRWIATLLSEGQHRDVLTIDDEQVIVGQPGSYVVVDNHGYTLLAMVTRTWQEELPPSPDGMRPLRRRVGLVPLGELVGGARFDRGVNHFPTVGVEVHVAGQEHLGSLFEAFREVGMELGSLSARKDMRVYVNPSPLFGRHLAILGQSGSGKSWTVASVLQKTVRSMPRAHIVLLDLHGEYCWKDENGTVHSAFPESMMRYVDARDLEIPYWLLNYEGLVELLIDRSDPNSPVQIAFLRDVVSALRKKANPDLSGVDRLSVDSPVYFSLGHLFRHFKEANEQQLDFGKAKGPLYGQFTEFLVKLQSRFNDSRYDFLLRPKRRNTSDSLESLLRDFVGLGEPKRSITIIDMSSVPADVRPTVSSQIGRLAFEFNYWNPERRRFPLLLVCEEAHSYIPRATADRQHESTRRAMERIAKEGRKYGVGLVVVSQRPHELSETVLSQCGNYLCLRITNPGDQDYVRDLVPESERNLLDLLTTLRRGEALVLGEAAPLPTRFMVDCPDPVPNSSDADYREGWTHGPEDLDIQGIVDRWRRQEH